LALRSKLQRNLLATVLLSQGTPFLLAGDEFGRTQHGNNNAYCQDNELSWVDWQQAGQSGQALLAFTRALILLRKQHIVFRRQHFFSGHTIPGTDVMDVVWFNSDGTPRMVSDWAASEASFLGFMLNGEAGDYHLTAAGERAHDVSALVAMNAGTEAVELWIPTCGLDSAWQIVVDTDAPDAVAERPPVRAGDMLTIAARSVVLMLCRNRSE
jgi:glycogen operon protein